MTDGLRLLSLIVRACRSPFESRKPERGLWLPAYVNRDAVSAGLLEHIAKAVSEIAAASDLHASHDHALGQRRQVERRARTIRETQCSIEIYALSHLRGTGPELPLLGPPENLLHIRLADRNGALQALWRKTGFSALCRSFLHLVPRPDIGAAGSLMPRTKRLAYQERLGARAPQSTARIASDRTALHCSLPGTSVQPRPSSNPHPPPAP